MDRVNRIFFFCLQGWSQRKNGGGEVALGAFSSCLDFFVHWGGCPNARFLSLRRPFFKDFFPFFKIVPFILALFPFPSSPERGGSGI